jgi:spoIIIJ-associated protein
MSNFIEKTGKTIEEAIAFALKDLKVDREMVDIEVMDEGNKGLFFGIIGNKLAKVKVAIKTDGIIAKVEDFVYNVISRMGVEANLDTTLDGDNIEVNISGENVGILIGRRGETLDALQYITSLSINRCRENHYRIMIDVERYRSRREDTLVALSERLAKKAIRTKRSVTLEPMTSYERRIIHASLQNNNSIETYSIGEEPYRKIVIKPK